MDSGPASLVDAATTSASGDDSFPGDPNSAGPTFTVVTAQGLPSITPGPSLIAPTTENSIWASGVMHIRWDTGMGIVVCPTAGPVSAPPKVFRVASPIGRKTVQGHTIKTGSNPLIPDPNPTDKNLTLIHKQLILSSPPVGPDAHTKVFRFDFKYEYVCNTITLGAGSDGLCMGSLPWMIDAPGNNISTADDYSPDLIGIDPAGGSGGISVNDGTGPDI